jgi:hypothetical protein
MKKAPPSVCGPSGAFGFRTVASAPRAQAYSKLRRLRLQFPRGLVVISAERPFVALNQKPCSAAHRTGPYFLRAGGHRPKCLLTDATYCWPDGRRFGLFCGGLNATPSQIRLRQSPCPLRVVQNRLLRISLLPGGKTMKALFVATVLAIIAAATVTVLTTRPQQAVAACTAAEC